MSRAMASTLDSGVGEILSTLKATRVYDKSIIVFSSDNGTFIGHAAQVPLHCGTSRPNYKLHESRTLFDCAMVLLGAQQGQGGSNHPLRKVPL